MLKYIKQNILAGESIQFASSSGFTDPKNSKTNKGKKIIILIYFNIILGFVCSKIYSFPVRLCSANLKNPRETKKNKGENVIILRFFLVPCMISEIKGKHCIFYILLILQL